MPYDIKQIIHVSIENCTVELNIQLSQATAATDLSKSKTFNASFLLQFTPEFNVKEL